MAPRARPGCCSHGLRSLNSSELGEEPMHLDKELSLGGPFRHRGSMVAALGLWAAGFALAGASGLRMHHAAAASYDGDDPRSWAAASTEASADIAEPEGAVYMPPDVIV